MGFDINNFDIDNFITFDGLCESREKVRRGCRSNVTKITSLLNRTVMSDAALKDKEPRNE